MLKEEKINPLLSVGMIIKNEEKVIGRCLESLVQLFDKVPCELIIADTGSTDRSVEIVRSYTENVFSFEWVNDFAAARNSTLDKARGKWFLFLDADEYLDADISELVDFFRFPDFYIKYNTMFIHFRNYTDKEKNTYKELYLPRFFRIEKTDNQRIRFVGRIHETVPVQHPIGRFEAIVHHTGYCYTTRQLLKKKAIRNHLPMRREFLEHPSLRMAVMLLESGGDTPGDCDEYILYGIDYIYQNRSDYYGKDFFVKAIKYYMHSYPDRALRLCDLYYDMLDNTENTTQTVSIEMFRTEILYKLFRFDEVPAAFEVYEQLYRKCESGEISVTADTGFSISGTLKIDYNGVRCIAIQSLIKIRKLSEAFKMLNEIKTEEYDDESYKTILNCWLELSEVKNNYASLIEVYKSVLKTDNNDKIDYFNELLHKVYLKIALDDERRKFVEMITDNDVSGNYVEIMRLIIYQDKNNIESFIENLKIWRNEYSELLYLAFKCKCKISDLSRIIPVDCYQSAFTMVAENHDDFTEYVLKYEIMDKDLLDIRFLGFITEIYKCAAFCCENVSEDEKFVIYKRYISLLGDYVMNLYNADFLDEKYIDTLPGEHQFGFYMYKSETCLIEYDKIGYIRYMKKALVSCESMKEIVLFLIEQFKSSL